MKNVRNIVAVTPVWNEPLGMIQGFQDQITEVRKKLNASGIGFRHFFLDDGSPNLPEEASILVRHTKNMGLAITTVDGYREALTRLKTPADLIVKIDCQEHDPAKILEAADHFAHTEIDALFFPVVYWIEGQPRRPMVEATRLMDQLRSALNPATEAVIGRIYNQEFPLGFQCYRTEALAAIFPKLEQALEIYEKRHGKKATWGLDLLAMVLAAQACPDRTDFIFGGWAKPWRENRGTDKIEMQRERVELMLSILQDLGLEVRPAAH